MPQSRDQIDRFMAAISSQESGGNYNATNKKSGAHGRFQIMPSNWPAWSREALGPGTHAQTPANQDKVARFKMLQYYDQFGSWEAVAVAWFAGPGRAAKYVKGDTSVLELSDGNMKVGAYINKMRAGMGQAGETIGGSPTTSSVAATGGGSAGKDTLPPSASPEQIDTYIRENYPEYAGFLDVPEIRGVLIDAARADAAGTPWSGEKLTARVRGSEWYKTNGEASRTYFARKELDPAQAKRDLEAKMGEIRPTWEQLGRPGDIGYWAENALKYGWTEQELRDQWALQLNAQSKSSGIAQGTTIDVSADDLMRIARSEYFVPINRLDAEKWAVDIFAGRKTEEQLRDLFARQSAARFPGLAEQGVTPGEYLAPLRNVIAETLELNPADIDFLNQQYSEVLEMQTDKGIRPMTISEGQRWARSRPAFQRTKGARDAAAGLAETLASTFGVV